MEAIEEAMAGVAGMEGVAGMAPPLVEGGGALGTLRMRIAALRNRHCVTGIA